MRSVLIAVALSLAVSACAAHARNSPSGSGELTWPEAQHLLKRCRVKALEQTHSRLVTLKLWDGGTATTHEPQLDDIFHLLNRLPHSCQPQSVATE